MGVLVTLVAITTYTFIGGFLAVSRTDVFQSLMMLAGFAILPALLIFMVDEPFQGLGPPRRAFGTRLPTRTAMPSASSFCSLPPAWAWAPWVPSAYWPA